MRAAALLPTFFFATAACVLTACTSAVTTARMARIQPGMKVAQVEAILGRPATIEQAETTGLSGEVYHYRSAQGEGRVVFLNDSVFKAEFIPGAKA